MKFGICAPIDKAGDVADAGWDYVEIGVSAFLEPSVGDSEWKGLEKARSAKIPPRSSNGLVPGNLKISGPDADLGKLKTYMDTVVARGAQVGLETMVFGSAGSRNVPEGFDRSVARQQIIDFAKMSAEICARHKVTLVVEPLNRKESNIINSVAEGMEYVRAVNHPNFQCLVDSYHFWMEDEPLESLRDAMPWIKHVHVADMVGRVPPGESGKANYVPFFKVLKAGGYDAKISVEASGFNDMITIAPRVLKFLKEQWAAA